MAQFNGEAIIEITTIESEFKGRCYQTRQLKEAAHHLLSLLNDDDLVEVLQSYCRYCGTANLPCHCNNDE